MYVYIVDTFYPLSEVCSFLCLEEKKTNNPGTVTATAARKSKIKETSFNKFLKNTAEGLQFEQILKKLV